MTQSKDEWLEKYKQFHSLNEEFLNQKVGDIEDIEFPSILPMVKKLAAQTIGLDLVPVQPIGMNSEEELERIKNEVKKENRDRKIDSITENSDFKEMKIEEHPEFKSGPKMDLLYLDFKYGSTSSSQNNNP
jgi:hypothetical protein